MQVKTTNFNVVVGLPNRRVLRLADGKVQPHQ
jgi:hypothetical protein